MSPLTNLNDLAATPFNDGVDVANLPAQMGGSEPPPQPGAFRFKLPKTLSLTNFDTIPAESTKGQGERLKVQFNDQAPLLIVQAHALAADRTNTPFKTTLTNTPRKRGKADDPNAPMAADWDYLNQGLQHKARPVGLRGYAQQLLADAQQEKEFGADIEWSWSCNPERPGRWVVDANGSVNEVETAPGVKKMGCGQRFYQPDVNKGPDGKYPLTITCGGCQAQIRAFGNLVRFRQ